MITPILIILSVWKLKIALSYGLHGLWVMLICTQFRFFKDILPRKIANHYSFGAPDSVGFLFILIYHAAQWIQFGIVFISDFILFTEHDHPFLMGFFIIFFCSNKNLEFVLFIFSNFVSRSIVVTLVNLILEFICVY